MNRQMHEKLEDVGRVPILPVSFSVTCNPGQIPFPSWGLSFFIYEIRPKEAGTADTEVSYSRDSQP